MSKLLAQHAERNSMLQRKGDRGGKGIHQPGDSRALLGHLDEDFARLAGGIKADGDVAFVTGNGEFVSDGRALILQAMTHCARRPVQILLRELGFRIEAEGLRKGWNRESLGDFRSEEHTSELQS